MSHKKLATFQFLCHLVLAICFIFPSTAESSRPHKKQIYRVAIDREYAPYEFIDSPGKVQGFTPALLREIAADAGISFDFTPMTWPAAMDGLKDGSVDLINMIRTPDRQLLYEFSEPHSRITQAIFRHANAEDIVDLKSLKGHKIGLQKSDIAIEQLQTRNDFSRIIFNSKLKGLLVLNVGKVDAFFCAQQAGIRLISKYSLANVRLAKPDLFPQDFCFASRKGNKKLIALLNKHLTTIKNSGRHLKLTEQWLSGRIAQPGWLETHRNIVIPAFLFFILILVLSAYWNILQKRQIKARKQTEEALSNSEERFRILYDKMPLPYQSLDNNGHIVEVNNTWLEMLGYSREEVIGKSFGDFLLPDWKEHFKYNFPRFKDKGEILGVEFEMVKKDGSVILASYNGKIAYDDQGNFKQTHCVFRDITEQSRVEEDLREAYRIINKSQAVAFLWKNAEGWPVEFVSDNVLKLLGYSADELISGAISYSQITHPEDLARVRSEVALFAEEKASDDFVHEPYRIVTKSNEIKWVTDHTFMRRDGKGRITHYQGVVEDITERKQAEDTLQVLVESTVGQIGQDYYDTTVSKLCDLFGCESAIVGILTGPTTIKTLSMKLDGEFIRDYSYELPGTPCENVAKQGFCAYQEDVCALFPDDKDLIDMDAEGYVGVSLFDKNHKPLGVLCAISRNKLNLPKRAEQIMNILAARASAEIERTQAAEEKDRYHTGLKKIDQWVKKLLAFKGNEDPFYQVVCDGIIDLMDADLSMLPFIDDSGVTFTYHGAAGDKAEMVLGKTIPIEGGGLCGWVAKNDKPLSVPNLAVDPRVIKELAIALDVTTGILCPLRSGKTIIGGLSAFRKGKPFEAIDEQLLTLFSQSVGAIFDNLLLLINLEEKVNERTMELQKTNKQLLHAEKLSAVGKLSASIAHEFNNPLYGVMNVLSGIKRRATLDAENKEMVGMAITECNRMKYLIKDLQDFNRPTSGKITPMDIHTAIDSMLMMTKKDFTIRKIILKKHCATNLPLVQAVEDQIKQVILNLLNNAADACENGGTLTISTEIIDKNIALHIHDTGKGIGKKDMDHIFEPFFTTKTAVKGTGLGLPVSYGIIKSHGGNITVKSKAGEGTTFTVTLPIKGVHNAK